MVTNDGAASNLGSVAMVVALFIGRTRHTQVK